jgi:uncharacterized phage protein (TIGR01671 family)
MLGKNNISTMAKREILFRGWNKKNKKWLYGYYLVNRGEHFISPDEYVNPLASYEDYVVDADTVSQYTGLKDAEGKKIFEGDIMVFYNDPHAIQYNEESSRFVAVQEEFPNIPFRIYQQVINDLKSVVAGNIHEGSELIKTDK